MRPAERMNGKLFLDLSPADIARRVAFFVALVACWELLSRMQLWPEYLFPSPHGVARALLLGFEDRTFLLGIAGSPGAGKSTLAAHLVRELNGTGAPWAAHVPMDGFHLADAELDRLGRRDRKGAPDTFDAAGYAALLRRLREETYDVVYAPGFERVLEQAHQRTPGVRILA